MYRSGLGFAATGVSLALATALAACGGGGDDKASSGDLSSIKNNNISLQQGSPTPRPEAKITISDNAFTPDTLTIKAGTKVVWTWTGSNDHSVLLGGQDSGQKTGSGTY